MLVHDLSILQYAIYWAVALDEAERWLVSGFYQ